MARRGLRETWEGWRTSRSCFHAWRLLVALRGPAHSNLRIREPPGYSDAPLCSRAQPTPAAEAWKLAAAFYAWGAETRGGGGGNRVSSEERRDHNLATVIASHRALVYLRHAGKGLGPHGKAGSPAREATARGAVRPSKRPKAAKRQEAVEAVNARKRQAEVRSWESANVKGPRLALSERRSRVPAGSAPGSAVERRQAEAQRRHAKECQAEFEAALAALEAEDTKAADLDPPADDTDPGPSAEPQQPAPCVEISEEAASPRGGGVDTTTPSPRAEEPADLALPSDRVGSGPRPTHPKRTAEADARLDDPELAEAPELSPPPHAAPRDVVDCRREREEEAMASGAPLRHPTEARWADLLTDGQGLPHVHPNTAVPAEPAQGDSAPVPPVARTPTPDSARATGKRTERPEPTWEPVEVWKIGARPAKRMWVPPGTGIQSPVLGTKTLRPSPVMHSGLVGSKTAAHLGKGIKGLGRAPVAGRGALMQSLAAKAGNEGTKRTRGVEDTEEVEPEARKRKREEPATMEKEREGRLNISGAAREASLARAATLTSARAAGEEAAKATRPPARAERTAEAATLANRRDASACPVKARAAAGPLQAVMAPGRRVETRAGKKRKRGKEAAHDSGKISKTL